MRGRKTSHFRDSIASQTLRRLLTTMDARRQVSALTGYSVTHINHLCYGITRVSDVAATALAPAVSHVTGEAITPAELLFGKAGGKAA